MSHAEARLPQSTPHAPRTGDDSHSALWAAFLLSVVIHGTLVGSLLYRDWLVGSQFQPETIDDKPTDFHAVGLYVKPRPEQQSRNNPDGPEQDVNNRPGARFNTGQATTARQDEVPKKPPVTPQFPDAGARTVGPGQPAVSNVAGSNDKVVAPSGLRNGATAAPRSFGNGNATFFTINDKGKRVIYVLDRSGSMIHNRALQVAKKELIASLNGLSPRHRFQIIFYDEAAYVLAVDSQRSKELVYATSRNIEKVKLKISAIEPKGGTRHMAALRPAIAQRPDVIFFLTDADSGLDDREMNEVRRLNRSKTRIHCIEFGKGPDFSGAGNFLKQLAAMTGGQYTYRDVQKFSQR